MAALDPLFRPRSVAILGASPGTGRGASLLRSIRGAGYEGAIFPVNPRYTEIDGLACHPAVDALPEAPDCAVVCVGAERAVDLVRDCARSGARAAIVLASGFGEAGAEGEARSRRLAEAAGAMPLCGPNCMGVLNMRLALPLGIEPARFLAGPIGAVMQSGALTVPVTDALLARGVGLSHVVSTGNEAVVGLPDYVDFLVDDPDTKVIVTFMEGIRDPHAFLRAAGRALRAGKPIVALKVGRSRGARAAAAAHTGSLVGSDEAYDALFAEAGVIRVADLGELTETALLLAGVGAPAAGGLTVVTFSGGGCGLVADLGADAGVAFSEFSPDTAGKLAAALPDFATVANPLDLTGAPAERPEIITDTLSVLLDADEVGLLGVSLAGGHGKLSGRLYGHRAEMLASAASGGRKPVFGFSYGQSGFSPEVLDPLAGAGIPLLQGERQMLAAVSNLARYAAARGDGGRPGPVAGPSANRDAALALLGTRQGPLTERESKRLLALYGIPVTRETLAANAEEAAAAALALGFPVVLKVESADLPHKSDVGGVRLNLDSAEAVALAFAEMMESVRARAPDAGIAGALVQEQLDPGIELVLGVKVDPLFGPLILLGMGGIFVEALSSFCVRMPLADRAAALRMIDALPQRGLLDGWRGRPAADLEAVADALVGLSALAVDLGPRLAAIDVNPVMVWRKGRGLRAADALIVAA